MKLKYENYETYLQNEIFIKMFELLYLQLIIQKSH